MSTGVTKINAESGPSFLDYLKKILEYLMAEDEARIAASLPGSVEEVLEKLGMDEGGVRGILERLFDKVVFP